MTPSKKTTTALALSQCRGGRGGRAPLSTTIEREQTHTPTGRGRNVNRQPFPPPPLGLCVMKTHAGPCSMNRIGEHRFTPMPLTFLSAGPKTLNSILCLPMTSVLTASKLTAKSMGFAEIEDRIRQEREDWSHYTGRAG